MASIDKIYVDNYKDYREFLDYIESIKSDIYSLYKYDIYSSIYFTNLMEESFDFSNKDYSDYPISNFPYCIDYYLIRHCTIPFIVERLKFVYGEDEYERIKISLIKQHIFENYKLFKFKYGANKGSRCKKQKSRYWIELNGPNDDDWWCYNEDIDEWVDISKSEMPFTSSSCYYGHSLKAVLRKIRKWYLPAGLELQLGGRYIGSCGKIILK